MNIAICDDDGRFRAQTARSLEVILDKRGLRASVASFRRAEDVVTAVEGGATFDLFLLDIVMPGMDGVALARLMRQRLPASPILFFTTSSDFAVEAFAVGAAHYIVKPFSRAQFLEALDRALALMPANKATGVVFKTANGLLNVPFDDLVHSETDEHYQLVQLSDGREFITRMSGQELWRIVEPTGQFVRAGLKHIFNLRYIQGVGRDGVTLTGGRVVEVPRRAMPELRERYLKFCCK